MSVLRIIRLTIFCMLISVTTWAAPRVARYRIIEIPLSIPRNGYAKATRINNRGDVVGSVAYSQQAFLYDYRSGAVNYLTFGSPTHATADGISDNGLIAARQSPNMV